MHDAPTAILGTLPIWPITDHDTPPAPLSAEAEARYVLRQQRPPSLDLSVLTIDGRFCVDCIELCLTDTHPGHWCPIDELGG